MLEIRYLVSVNIYRSDKERYTSSFEIIHHFVFLSPLLRYFSAPSRHVQRASTHLEDISTRAIDAFKQRITMQRKRLEWISSRASFVDGELCIEFLFSPSISYHLSCPIQLTQKTCKNLTIVMRLLISQASQSRASRPPRNYLTRPCLRRPSMTRRNKHPWLIVAW